MFISSVVLFLISTCDRRNRFQFLSFAAPSEPDILDDQKTQKTVAKSLSARQIFISENEWFMIGWTRDGKFVTKPAVHASIITNSKAFHFELKSITNRRTRLIVHPKCTFLLHSKAKGERERKRDELMNPQLDCLLLLSIFTICKCDGFRSRACLRTIKRVFRVVGSLSLDCRPRFHYQQARIVIALH